MPHQINPEEECDDPMEQESPSELEQEHADDCYDERMAFNNKVSKNV